MCRLMERTMVRTFLYPTFLDLSAVVVSRLTCVTTYQRVRHCVGHPASPRLTPSQIALPAEPTRLQRAAGGRPTFQKNKPKSRFARFWLAASAVTENSAAILSCGGPASPLRLSPAHCCRTQAAPACSFGEPSQCKQQSVQHAALSDIVHG